MANNEIKMTQYQTELSLKLGADEIDTVLNISAIKKNSAKNTNHRHKGSVLAFCIIESTNDMPEVSMILTFFKIFASNLSTTLSASR